MAGVPGQIVCNVATVSFVLILVFILIAMIVMSVVSMLICIKITLAIITIWTKILPNQAPGSFGCTMNTLHCYMESCGLVNLPRLPWPLNKSLSRPGATKTSYSSEWCGYFQPETSPPQNSNYQIKGPGPDNCKTWCFLKTAPRPDCSYSKLWDPPQTPLTSHRSPLFGDEFEAKTWPRPVKSAEVPIILVNTATTQLVSAPIAWFRFPWPPPLALCVALILWLTWWST